ncbi:hypothetical protein [Enterobacter rongchengensis]|uniref:hypothetical protein n=1 Tax=Enterobacter rongchengensis TaxID=3030999 RepID=UPI003B436562
MLAEFPLLTDKVIVCRVESGVLGGILSSGYLLPLAGPVPSHVPHAAFARPDDVSLSEVAISVDVRELFAWLHNVKPDGGDDDSAHKKPGRLDAGSITGFFFRDMSHR